MTKLVAALAVAGSLLAAQGAAAATYNFVFTGTGTNVQGSLTTSTSGASQLITGLNATYNGAATTLSAPGVITVAPTNDNLLFPTATGNGSGGGTNGYLDGGGFAFSSGSAVYNVFYAATNNYGFYVKGASTATFGGTFTLSQVAAVSAAPEPGAWALMLGGVGAMGLALRSRRRQPKLARVAV